VTAHAPDLERPWDPDAMPGAPEGDDLVLLANESMRARRAPLAIVAVWLWEAAIALLVAWPIAAAVRAFFGGSPDGDASLWTPGAFDLAWLVFHARGAHASAVALVVLVLFAAAFVDLVPLGALVASCAFVTRARRPPPLGAAIGRSGRAFPTLASLLVLGGFAQLFLVFAGIVFGAALSESLAPHLGKPRADQVALVVGAAFAIGVAYVQIAHDLARAATVRFRVRWIRAVRCAMNAIARGPRAILWSWGWRAAAAWAPVGVGALVAGKLGGRGGDALAALFVVHQLAILARVALRASWLAKALRAVDHAHRVIRQ
jgi:hypothetical protein